MPTGLEYIRSLREADRRRQRRLRWLGLAVILGVYLLLLCFRGLHLGFISPGMALRDIGAFLRVTFWRVFSPDRYQTALAQAVAMPYYAEVAVRFRTGILMIVSGAILALSGTVYQAAMRNPMAVPTMLGVSSGVELAQVIMVLLYGELAYEMGGVRYLLSYGISIAALLLVLLGGKLAGGKRVSVSDMLIVGVVVNRLMSTVTNYLRTNMDTETLTLYQEFAQKAYDNFGYFKNIGIVVLVAAVLLLPIFFMRFSYNAVCFEDTDALTMGVRPGFMRVYGLIAGALLTTTAMIHTGNVGMLAMVVPHLCRYIFGADFKRLLLSSAFIGALLMLMSRVIAMFAVWDGYELPVGNIISLLCVPLLIWAMLRQRRGWE